MGSQKQLIESEAKSVGGGKTYKNTLTSTTVLSQNWRATDKESTAIVRDWVKHWIKTAALHSVLVL